MAVPTYLTPDPGFTSREPLVVSLNEIRKISQMWRTDRNGTVTLTIEPPIMLAYDHNYA